MKAIEQCGAWFNYRTQVVIFEVEWWSGTETAELPFKDFRRVAQYRSRPTSAGLGYAFFNPSLKAVVLHIGFKEYTVAVDYFWTLAHQPACRTNQPPTQEAKVFVLYSTTNGQYVREFGNVSAPHVHTTQHLDRAQRFKDSQDVFERAGDRSIPASYLRSYALYELDEIQSQPQYTRGRRV